MEKMVDEIMSMSDDVIKVKEKTIIGDFPNTYTFTKNLAEKYIYQNLGDIKCVIWRPSIIGCSLSQPVPGWTDSISAAGGLTFLATAGILKNLYMPNSI